MNEVVKKQMLKSAEKLTEAALDEALAIAEVLAADSESTVDDSAVSVLKMVKQGFLDSLVDKIDGEEG